MEAFKKMSEESDKSLKKPAEIIKETVFSISKPDKAILKEAQIRLDNLTKPLGSLGRLEELAKQIASITGKINTSLSKKLMVVMAADHGVVKEGVSAYPSEVTVQMVYNFLRGGAAINVLADHIGADVVVVDVGVNGRIELESFIKNLKDSGHSDLSVKGNSKDVEKIGDSLGTNSKKEMSDRQNLQAYFKTSGVLGLPFFIDKKIAPGTENIANGPAMTRSQAEQAISTGIEVACEMIDLGYKIIGTGDMGIGNTTASSAIAACICSLDPSLVTGYGTGIDEEGFKRKVEVIRQAININKPDKNDGIDVLSKIGGFEIGAIAGIILGSAFKKTPVVIDGFISGAAALIAEAISADSRDYMIASHCSVEKGHKKILEKLDLKPLFNFDLRLGEGTGAALGISVAEAAMKILNEMATFDSAGVSKKNE